MPELVSPGLIDAIIGMVAIEAAAIFFFLPKMRKAIDLWLTLASGAALLIAVRLAIGDGGSSVIAAALALSFIAHLFYLRVRLRT